MKRFKGSIVIGDPSYFIKTEDDWERCEYGSNLAVLGFTDYLYLDFPIIYIWISLMILRL